MSRASKNKCKEYLSKGQFFFPLLFIQLIFVSLFLTYHHKGKKITSMPKKAALQIEFSAKLVRTKPHIFKKTVPIKKTEKEKKNGTGLKSNKNKKELFSAYLREIRSRIENHKYYPYREKNFGREGVVRIRMELKPNGHVHSLRIIMPSLHTGLNEAAEQSIASAQPFPPFPKEISEEKLVIEYDLSYTLKK